MWLSIFEDYIKVGKGKVELVRKLNKLLSWNQITQVEHDEILALINEKLGVA